MITVPWADMDAYERAPLTDDASIVIAGVLEKNFRYVDDILTLLKIQVSLPVVIKSIILIWYIEKSSPGNAILAQYFLNKFFGSFRIGDEAYFFVVKLT